MNEQINSIKRQLSDVHNGLIWAGTSYNKKLSQLKENGKLVKTGRGLVEESLPKKSGKK